MRVEIKLSEEFKDTYAIIYTKELSEEVQRAVEILEAKENVITAKDNEKISIIEPKEIYMIRMENKEVVIYCEKKKFISGKKLYELERILGDSFMRISKGTIVNLKMIDSVEPSFNAMMYLVMKNGCKDYISRTYLAEFKKYLGL